MADRTTFRLRAPISAALCLLPAACASTSHVTAFQESAIAPPRSLTLTLDQDEKLPFGIRPADVADGAARAGFVMRDDNPRYRLAVTGAAGSSDAGSYLPPAEAKGRANWVGRPDHNWRARFAGGRVLRITAVLIDAAANREVWRGTGTLRTSDPVAAARQLTDEVLAKLPHG